MKKFIIGGVGTILCLGLLVLVLPFLIDFNHFKPQIRKVVTEHTNIDLDFESARLSLYPNIGIKLSKVKVENTDPIFNGTKLFSVNQIIFGIGLSNLIQGKYIGSLLVDSPDFEIVTGQERNNLASIMKGTTQQNQDDQTTPENDQSQSESSDLANKILIESIQITKANIHLKSIDQPNVPPKSITDLGIEITNLGLNHEISTKITSNIKFESGEIKAKGPIDLILKTLIEAKEASNYQVKTNGRLDLDNFDINVRDAFVKPPGIDLNITFKAIADQNQAQIRDLSLNLHTLNIAGFAKIADLTTLATNLQVNVEQNNLKELERILPQHKELLMAGKLALKASLNGLLTNLLKLKASVDLSTKLGQSDLQASLTAENLGDPIMKATLDSKHLDLNKILGPFMPKEVEGSKESQVSSPETKANAEGPAVDFALTDAQKELLKPAQISFRGNLNKIIFRQFNMDNLVVKVDLKDLKIDLNPLSLDIFSGSVRQEGSVDLNKSPVETTGNLSLKAIQMHELLAAFIPEHKDALEAKVNISLAGNAQGTTTQTIRKNLNAEGSFEFIDGKLSSKSIASQLGASFDENLNQLNVTNSAEKAGRILEKFKSNPLTSKVRVPSLTNIKSQVEKVGRLNFGNQLDRSTTLKGVTGQFTIKDGQLTLASKDSSKNGQMTSSSTISLLGALSGSGQFVGTKSFSNQLLGQTPYAKVLLNNEGLFELPFQLGGTISSPKVSIENDELKKRIEEQLNKEVTNYVNSQVSREKNRALQESKNAMRKQLEEQKQKARAKAQERQKEVETQAKAEKEKLKKKAEDKLKKSLGF